MKSEDNRNIKVRAKSELNIFQNKKSRNKSLEEKRGMSMYVKKPKKSSSNSQHSTYSWTAQRNSIRLKNITQIKVRLKCYIF